MEEEESVQLVKAELRNLSADGNLLPAACECVQNECNLDSKISQLIDAFSVNAMENRLKKHNLYNNLVKAAKTLKTDPQKLMQRLTIKGQKLHAYAVMVSRAYDEVANFDSGATECLVGDQTLAAILKRLKRTNLPPAYTTAALRRSRLWRGR